MVFEPHILELEKEIKYLTIEARSDNRRNIQEIISDIEKAEAKKQAFLISEDICKKEKERQLKVNEVFYNQGFLDGKNVQITKSSEEVKKKVEELKTSVGYINWQFYWFDGGQERIVKKISNEIDQVFSATKVNNQSRETKSLVFCQNTSDSSPDNIQTNCPLGETIPDFTQPQNKNQKDKKSFFEEWDEAINKDNSEELGR